ncbi:MAG: acyl-CoA dehydrogenase [Planctomycetota bacterium]|nr:MAG: acyl-CoA dehydrogenase [Planctomycetota bacterium]
MNEIVDQIEEVLCSLKPVETESAERWPHDALRAVGAAGAWRSIIPAKWGGAELAYADLLRTYETIAKHSVALALILTQRDGACDLIARGDNPALKDRVLPRHAGGERFTTVGIAQLTTSKGAGGPKARARRVAGGFVLDGLVPWATGAAHCDEIVVGAVTADDLQLLVCLPRDAEGVIVQPPARLMALSETDTSMIELNDVRVGDEHVIRGPCGQALSGRAPVKGLTVSAVGIGLASAIHQRLTELEEHQPPELREPIAPLHAEYGETRDALRAAAARVGDQESRADAPEIRVRVNALLTRLAVTLLNISKGGGFVSGRPAERLLREAMFFHVWSSPVNIQAGTLRRLLGAAEA